MSASYCFYLHAVAHPSGYSPHILSSVTEGFVIVKDGLQPSRKRAQYSNILDSGIILLE
jgi:hypothetical protein